MKDFAQIAVAFAPVVFAGALPFIRVFRGASIGKWFCVCWLLIIVWMFIFSFLVPVAAFQINRDFGRTVSSWVPEGPAAFAMIFFGWFYAGLTVGAARLLQRATESARDRNSKTPDNGQSLRRE